MFEEKHTTINSFTELSSSEIIEDNQAISEKYCGQKDTDIGEIFSKSDGGGITFDDNLCINLLDNHFKPDKNFEFPRKLLHGCKRSFSHKWIMKYPFLAYSRYLDALFCLPCVLFSKSKENNFTKIPGFSKWYKTGEKVEEHSSSSVHDRSMSRLEEFKERLQNPRSTVPYTTDKTLQQRVEHNTKVLKWIIEVVLSCGKQCLPLRGHLENINNSSHNSGSFLAIVKLFSQTNKKLKEHLLFSVAQNAKCISPKIQNKIINIIAYDMLQKDLIDEIKQPSSLQY